MDTAAAQPDEIDRAALRAIVGRFRAHHAWRVERTGARLISRHRRVLDALPMLFHRNHPALPGYAGAQAPHGIAGFRPGAEQRRALRRVARSFDDPLLPPGRHDIQAMFLMGSGGTIGQSRRSDIDLWVCCDSLVHAALWPKVRMIDCWAADLGLELHTFLVDPAMLRVQRRLPGSRIPTLVLDEFYRTGALLAGCYPLWWLIAEDDPQRYAAMRERLIRQRFIRPEAVVDFGPVGPFPADELTHGVLTELQRALATPHKSLLKLKLMETYARAPELGPVSSSYRARVHAGVTEALDLDPYLLLYDHVERYLMSAAREDELTLVRRLLIGKAAENVRWQPPARDAQGNGALAARFERWGFQSDAVARFRSVDGWSMRERLAENGRIIHALERGLELVQSLLTGTGGGTGNAPATAERPMPVEPQLRHLNEKRLAQLALAVHRLRPRRERISVLHPALSSSAHPPTLRLHREAGCWRVRESAAPVKRCARLVEAVIWSELNGANLVPAPRQQALAPVMLQILQGFRENGRKRCIFVNAESLDESLPTWRLTGAGEPAETALPAATASGGLEAPGHVSLHLLTPATLDIVSRDGDGQWQVETVTNAQEVPEALARLLASPPQAVAWLVPGGQQRFVMVDRLRRLHTLAWRMLETPGHVFALPIQGSTLTVRRHATGVETRRHRTPEALAAYLAGTSGPGSDGLSKTG